LAQFSEDQLPPGPLTAMYHYWRSKCRDKDMPSRADIHPSEMKDFLPHTMLIDVVATTETERRFRMRLVGTHIVDGFGQEVTGKFIDEINTGGQMESLLEACMKSVQEKAPVYLSGVMVQQTPAGTRFSFERLGAPLSSDGQNVDMLLIAAVLQHLPAK
jgi:hypothetical protein